MNRDTPLRTVDVPSPETVLCDQRRRHVLRVLSRWDEPVSVKELATAVRALETDTDPAAVPSVVTEDVSIALHHRHLPKLADANVVDYDARTRTVVPVRVEQFVPDGVDLVGR